MKGMTALFHTLFFPFIHWVILLFHKILLNISAHLCVTICVHKMHEWDKTQDFKEISLWWEGKCMPQLSTDLIVTPRNLGTWGRELNCVWWLRNYWWKWCRDNGKEYGNSLKIKHRITLWRSNSKRTGSMFAHPFLLMLCPSPQIHMVKTLTPKKPVFGGEAFGRELGHENGALVVGFETF